jgi:acylphosphatase
MSRRRIRFTGRVQGVGFRATARSVAAGFAVTGWVRNEPDGAVLLEVQGADAEIDAFLSALRDRMRGYIKSESADAIAAAAGERGFAIER